MPTYSSGTSTFSVSYTTTSNESEWYNPVATAQVVRGEYVQPHPLATRPKKQNVAAIASVPAGINLGSELLVFYKRNRAPGNYEEAHRHQGETLHQNVQDLLARFFITIHYNSGPIANWREWCVGIASAVARDNLGRRLGDSMHMPMFDYDGKNIKGLLRKDVQLLQKRWGLGPATLFQTKKGFHVYFMTDVVSWDAYHTMLSEIKCCEGFKRCAKNAGYGVLRVSAKYSTFDIKMDSIMLPENPKAAPARKIRKAHMVEALLALGERCGTHFASLYPEWAHYREDETPWKQLTRVRMFAKLDGLKGGYPGDRPRGVKAEMRNNTKAKLMLKPLKPGQQMPVHNHGMVNVIPVNTGEYSYVQGDPVSVVSVYGAKAQFAPPEDNNIQPIPVPGGLASIPAPPDNFFYNHWSKDSAIEAIEAKLTDRFGRMANAAAAGDATKDSNPCKEAQVVYANEKTGKIIMDSGGYFINSKGEAEKPKPNLSHQDIVDETMKTIKKMKQERVDEYEYYQSGRTKGPGFDL